MNGIYNVGTSEAASFNQLVNCLGLALNKKIPIEYIAMPTDLSNQYQNFTQADISKLRSQGYSKNFYSLEEGIKEYIQQYVLPKKHL